MRALLDLLVALRGTVTVALRRSHPAVLVGAGLGIVALVAGAVLVLGGDGDPGDPPAGYEVGAPGDAGGAGPAGRGGDELPAGDPLVSVLGGRPADQGPPGAGTAPTGGAGSDVAAADGTTVPAGAGTDGERGEAAVPGTSGDDPSTAPAAPSFDSAPPPTSGTTTTEAPADPGGGQGGGDSGGDVLGGLLDLLGLG
ncbi:MAG TPA: hypothetical protein VFZ79_16420 [Acidimicrobiales bacterium]